MRQNIKSMAGNFHYLFRELYLFRRSSVFLPVLGGVSRILQSWVVIWIPKIILDLIESRADFGRLLLVSVVSGGALIIVSAANAIAHDSIDSCSQVFLFAVLKTKWEEKMMDLDYEAFSSSAGKIGAEKARNAVSSPNFGVVAYLPGITELLESMGGFLVLGAAICMLQPLILFLLLLLFGIELWYGAFSEERKHRLQGERAHANRKLNYIAYHTRGIREGKDIRIYSMTDWLRRNAGEAVADKDRVEERAARQDFKKMVLNGMFIFLRNGCAYAYLVWQYFQGGMTVGDFTLSFSAITGLGSFLSQLTRGYSGFVEADNYVADFRQFMEMGAEREEKKYSADDVTGPVSFTWENVSFSYRVEEEEEKHREVPVLKHISLTIKEGEKLAIVGINGAGKTTFVKLLCGLLRPTEGRILVNGMDTADLKGEDYRKLFSAVFQKSGVLPVSIRDNITLSMWVTERGNCEKTACRPNNLSMDSKETESCSDALWNCIRLADLEEKVRSLPEGLDTPLVKRITERGTELSGGELQRLLLARALYKDAPVLILDEPTAALDPIAENAIYQAYNKLTKGKTSVFISHRLASTRFCDRILVMEKGEIVENGTHEELMEQKGRYAEMFRVQSRYYDKEVSSHE